jgi:hypothetical protein
MLCNVSLQDSGHVGLVILSHAITVLKPFEELRWPNQGILRGKDHCTVDLLFDWFGVSCMTTDNFFLFAKQTNPNQSNRRSMVQ